MNVFAGICIGFLVGVVTCAHLAKEADMNRIKSGTMERDGVVYRITKAELK